MNKLNKYSYKLKTLSNLIISPRQQQAIYVDSYSKAKSDTNSINIVYPFYQRGEYQHYQEKNCQYYIPGSSIKGVLLSKQEEPTLPSSSLLMDDIQLNPADIKLGQINKLQNTSVDTEKKVKFEVFFPNVAMEMCQPNTIKIGELFSSYDPINYFKEEHKNTLKKLKQWSNRIDKVKLEKELAEDVDNKLDDILNTVKIIQENQQADSYFMIIGGYKGLLLSTQLKKTDKDQIEAIKSGIFIDPVTKLPYGLVEISEVKQNE